MSHTQPFDDFKSLINDLGSLINDTREYNKKEKKLHELLQDVFLEIGHLAALQVALSYVELFIPVFAKEYPEQTDVIEEFNRMREIIRAYPAEEKELHNNTLDRTNRDSVTRGLISIVNRYLRAVYKWRHHEWGFAMHAKDAVTFTIPLIHILYGRGYRADLRVFGTSNNYRIFRIENWQKVVDLIETHIKNRDD